MKQKKVFLKKVIDERQEAELNRLFSGGYHLVFYLLLIVLVIEALFLKRPFQEWAAVWAVFMIAAVYEIWSCFRAGVWTPYEQKPGRKNYIGYSLAGALPAAGVMVAIRWGDAPAWQDAALIFLIDFLVYFAMFLVIFFAAGGLYNRMRRKREERLDRELMLEEETEESGKMGGQDLC